MWSSILGLMTKGKIQIGKGHCFEFGMTQINGTIKDPVAV